MRLNYLTYGEAGPPVAILHGLLGTGRNWHTIARRLQANFQVLTPDLRNHGRSPHGKHTFKAICDDVAELIDELGWERFHLVGHSMGGAAAMKFAFEYPEWLNSLTVVDISPASSPEKMSPVLEAMLRIDLAKVSRKEEVEEQLSQSIKDPMVRQFLLTNLRLTKRSAYEWQCNLEELYRFVKNDRDLRVDLRGQFSGKSLFIGGENSEYQIGQQRSAITEYFRNAEIRLIPHAGHWLHADAPDEFLKILTAFLEKAHEL